MHTGAGRTFSVPGSFSGTLHGVTADPSLTNALDTLLRRRAGLDRAIAALQEVIESEGGSPAAQPAGSANLSGVAVGRGTASGVLTTTPNERRGARTDTAEAIITERPGVGVSPQELADAMAERGVPIRSDNPVRAARAVADRVRTRNPNVELENGRFVYRPPESPNGSGTADSADSDQSRFRIPSPFEGGKPE
jgi:hypothetical protein